MRPRRRSVSGLSGLWRLAAVLAVVAAAWAGGLFWFVRQIPVQVADTTSRTDAIVVLTGGAIVWERGLN